MSKSELPVVDHVKRAAEIAGQGAGFNTIPAPVITTYSYDNRGNLVAEYKNDVLDREYTFSARNLLEKAK